MIGEATATLPSVGDVTLIGGVIAGLFGLLRYLWVQTDKSLTKLAESSERIAEKHDKAIVAIRDAHKAERDEWRSDQRTREERLNQVCDAMIKAIHEQKSTPSSPSSG